MSDEANRIKEAEDAELKKVDLTLTPAARMAEEALRDQIVGERADIAGSEKVLADVFDRIAQDKMWVAQATGILGNLEETLQFIRLRETLRKMALFYSVGFTAGRKYQKEHPEESVESSVPGPRLVQ